MMTATQIQAQCSTGLSRHGIEQAVGNDLDHLQPADLAQLEDFNTPALVNR